MIHWTWLILAFSLGATLAYGFLNCMVRLAARVTDAIEFGSKHFRL